MTEKDKLEQKIDHLEKSNSYYRQANEELSYIIQNANSIIVKIDSNGNITFWNQFAEKYFGYSEKEAVGRSVRELCIPEVESTGRDLRFFRQDLLCHPENYPNQFHENITKDGRRVWANWSNHAIYHPDGSLKEILSVGNDATELKRLAQAREEENRAVERTLRKLTTAVEQSPLSVVITDLEGNIEYVNPHFSRVTGYSLDEVKGNNPRVLKSGVQGPEVYRQLWQSITRGGVWRGEFHNKCKDGSLFWEAATISPIRDSDGSIVSYLAIKEDITEWKQTQEELAFAYAQMHELFNAAPDLTSVIGVDYRVMLINNTLAEKLGISRQEAVGRKCYEVYGNSMCNTSACPLSRILGGEQRVEAEVNIRLNDGRELPCLFTAIAYRPAGKLLGIIETFKDMTEHKRAEEAMRKDFQLGSKIQRQFIPWSFSNELITLDVIYEPYNHVSGDLCDFLWVNDRKLFGYVIDVMGHGLATALQTSALRVLFNQAARQDGRLIERMYWLNRAAMPYFAEDSFAGAICFEIDFEAMTITCVSAGINFLIAATDSMQGVVRFPGSFLGISDSPVFEERSVPIRYGDAWFFLSDGIFDLMDDAVVAAHLTNYEAALRLLRNKAVSSQRWDDATALCLRINAAPTWPISLTFHDVQNFRDCRVRLRQILRQLARDKAAMLEIAINEAANNAVRAAEQTDRPFAVRLKVNHQGRWLIIRIKDSGNGFNGNERVAAIEGAGCDLFAAAMLQESGRGIMIMKGLFKKVLYNRTGTEVLLAQDLTAPDCNW